MKNKNHNLEINQEKVKENLEKNKNEIIKKCLILLCVVYEQ